MTGEEKREILADMDEEILFADGLDDALIGVADAATGLVAVYDYNKVLELLAAQNDGPDAWDRARDFYYNDVLRALQYYGPKAPVFIDLEVFDEW